MVGDTQGQHPDYVRSAAEQPVPENFRRVPTQPGFSMKIFTNEILSEEEERISAEFDATDDTPVDPDDPIYSGGYEIPLEQRHFKD